MGNIDCVLGMITAIGVDKLELGRKRCEIGVSRQRAENGITARLLAKQRDQLASLRPE